LDQKEGGSCLFQRENYKAGQVEEGNAVEGRLDRERLKVLGGEKRKKYVDIIERRRDMT